MPWLIGIDPGLTGAIVMLDAQSGAVHGIYDMPVMARSDRNTKGIVDPVALSQIFAQYAEATVYLEQVQAMPRTDKQTGQRVDMGTASSFNFGEGVGIIFGVASVFYGRQIKKVVPTVWKRHWDLLKTEKDAARLRAIEVFPAVQESLARKKDSGRADALLIAGYGLFKEKQ